ncbi:MAG: substrate-binding domain-containing protein [Thermoplasmata archaeon]
MIEKKAKIAVIMSCVFICITSIIAFWQINSSNAKLILATTTSLYDSGLLSEILPEFEEAHDAKVYVIAVGTGQALEYGKRGDADVLLVHAPELEKEYIDAGFGTERRELFQNYFVLIGPKTNPAGISSIHNITQAFEKIYSSSSKFVSRGDLSGTHLRERQIWQQLGISLDDLKTKSWYLNGSGSMSTALMLANEKGAYVLCDPATWAFLKPKLGNLEKFEIQKNADLVNIYSLLITKSGSEKNGALIKKFETWLQSPETLSKIENYTINSEQLFWTRW